MFIFNERDVRIHSCLTAKESEEMDFAKFNFPSATVTPSRFHPFTLQLQLCPAPHTQVGFETW